MTPETLRRIGMAVYGLDWHAPMAYELAIRERRIVRAWDEGDTPIPETARRDLVELVHRYARITDKMAETYIGRARTLNDLSRELLDRTTDSAKAGN